MISPSLTSSTSCAHPRYCYENIYQLNRSCSAQGVFTISKVRNLVFLILAIYSGQRKVKDPDCIQYSGSVKPPKYTRHRTNHFMGSVRQCTQRWRSFANHPVLLKTLLRCTRLSSEDYAIYPMKPKGALPLTYNSHIPWKGPGLSHHTKENATPSKVGSKIPTYLSARSPRRVFFL